MILLKKNYYLPSTYLLNKSFLHKIFMITESIEI